MPPEMIEMMKGAGVRCFKHRAGMPILGFLGKHGNTRFNNSVLPLLDTWIRKVNPRSGARGALLEQLHLARRPGSFAALVERHAKLRYRFERHAVFQDEHELGQELRGK